MKRLIVANWKMNMDPGQASLYVNRLDKKVEAVANTEVVICPPYLDLYPMSKEINHKKFQLGAQNLHYLDEGPYTGEISGSMLKGLATYVIIGHSERRAAGETDKLIAKKMAAAIRNGLRPILCVGENLNEREHGLAEKVVVDQLTADLRELTADDLKDLVIAYEPVWAINHHDGHVARAATPEETKFAYRAIRTTLEELYGEQGISGLRLLYGGSSNPENTKAFLELPHVDGLLPGTASLNYESFAKMIKLSQDL